MQINTKDKTTKEINKVLNLQMGGWLLESHCWGLPDNDGIQTCYWCRRKYKVADIVKSTYPFCRNNPALLKLLKKYKKFLDQKRVDDMQEKLLQLKKEMDELSKRAHANASKSVSKDEDKWHL